ncbi:RNA polymerase sigma factor [Abyssalbus ytuae]|uniref:RNA polymerase sigma factor n=1 Tax=Abyssalbus ytuae TaxID=2926907 RepID=A0A9E6ZLE5_9FLAO|nr:RNA polymerase sigma-70 factor [Abyssalbus ytuae]UOB17942.1 RNA polymerase sigma-70 factor [Abyssalbus ytuae]
MSEKALHNEKLLVKQLIAGNEKAFIKLYNTYKNTIYGYSLKLVKSNADAEEIIQDVFMKVWEKRKTLDPSLSFKSYLFTVARNTCFNFLRKSSNDAKMKEKIFYKSQKSFEPADRKLIASEFERLKNGAYDKLPPKRRAIFEMSREEGMSYPEIAKKMGISVNTVKVQMSKALETLRDFLKTIQVFL